MDRDDIGAAAVVAENISGFLRGAQRYTGEDFDWCVEQSRLSFRDLAGLLGYRVERITDGVNTGKPAVVGGV